MLITAVSGKWWIGLVVFALVVVLGCVDFYDKRQAQRQEELTHEQWILARAYVERLNGQAAASPGEEQANLLWQHPELFWTPKIRADGG